MSLRLTRLKKSQQYTKFYPNRELCKITNWCDVFAFLQPCGYESRSKPLRLLTECTFSNIYNHTIFESNKIVCVPMLVKVFDAVNNTATISLDSINLTLN